MTLREFVQHLLLNGELDDELTIEAKIPEDCSGKFTCLRPTHVTHTDDRITYVDCVVDQEEE